MPPLFIALGSQLLVLRFGFSLATRRYAGQLAELRFDLSGCPRIMLEIVARRLTSLTDSLSFIGVPGAGLLDQTLFHTHIDQLACFRNAFCKHHIELRLF